MGQSVRGARIEARALGNGADVTLFLGVHHGNETQGQYMLERLMERLNGEPRRLDGRRAVFVPVLNPDGFADNVRHNANGVDLNRNLPTRDWGENPARPGHTPGPNPASEPETRALMALVEREAPTKIVTIHAPLLCVNWNGLSRHDVAGLPAIGPSRYHLDNRSLVCAEDLGAAVSACNGYPLRGDIGYPCPGSFGTWAGHERHIATITLELGRDVPPERAWRQNEEALLAALAF